MFNRGWLFGVVIVGTAALPYLMSSGTLPKLLQYARPKGSAADAVELPVAPAAPVPGQVVSLNGTALPPPVPRRPEHVPTHSLDEVLRFEATTAWLLSNWPRVSADLAELDLQGYRVPLVSGTTDADVAGSLTYYFNPKQQVARITLFGSTGDPRKLVSLLESRFGFQQVVAAEPNLFLYQVKSGGKVTSEMRIRPSAVIRADVPHARFEVALLVERPKGMR